MKLLEQLTAVSFDELGSHINNTIFAAVDNTSTMDQCELTACQLTSEIMYYRLIQTSVTFVNVLFKLQSTQLLKIITRNVCK